MSLSLSENKLYAVLESAHECTLREASNLAAGAAIHAAIWPIEINVVEQIIEFELGLCFELFSEVKGLEKRGVGAEKLRPAELVYTATTVSEGVESGCLTPWSRCCAESI